MSGHKVEIRGIIVSQLEDLNTLHSIIVDELKQNDIFTKFNMYQKHSTITTPVLKFIIMNYLD